MYMFVCIYKGTIQDQKSSIRKLFTLLGNVRFVGGRKLRFWGSKMSKNIFNLCSHIQKNTPNPNPIFKITIYCTRQTNNAKILSICCKSLKDVEKQKPQFFYFITYIISIIHILYFVNFVILGFGDCCIFIFIYITRVGLLQRHQAPRGLQRLSNTLSNRLSNRLSNKLSNRLSNRLSKRLSKRLSNMQQRGALLT